MNRLRKFRKGLVVDMWQTDGWFLKLLKWIFHIKPKPPTTLVITHVNKKRRIITFEVKEDE